MSTAFGASGCCYPVDDDDRLQQCGAELQLGSSYCAEHHALCYLPRNSPLEHSRLRTIERIGEAVGGRTARTRAITTSFLRRVEDIQDHA